MRNPHRITPNTRDFNSQNWFRNNEIPNPTCVLAGDHPGRMPLTASRPV